MKLVEKIHVNENILQRKFELRIAKDGLGISKQSSGPFEQANVEMIDEEEECLIVEHLHHFGWEDDTAKQDESLLNDVDLIMYRMNAHRDINILTQTETKPAPIVVHCSAGIGRTGTIVAIFNMIEAIQYTCNNMQDLVTSLASNLYMQNTYPDIINDPLRISIFGCVRKLREQRMLMVKKEE